MNECCPPIYIYIYIYIYTRTHTHTHTYIYIYIYILHLNTINDTLAFNISFKTQNSGKENQTLLCILDITLYCMWLNIDQRYTIEILYGGYKFNNH